MDAGVLRNFTPPGYQIEDGRVCVIPEGYTRIDTALLEGNDEIVRLVLPRSLVSIGPRAFSCCPNLRKVTLPKKLEQLGEYTFSSSSLANITVPGSVKGIPRCCFSSSTHLYEVVLEEGITAIGPQALADCPNLSQVHIPASVSAIAEDAFENCPHLRIVTLSNSFAADFARQHNVPTTER